MTVKDGKTALKQGTILAAMLDAVQGALLIPFMPYFKLLFKLCQIGLMMKKKQSLERKQIDADEYIADKTVKIASASALIDNLSFHERITAQILRTNEQDISAITNKQDRLRREIERTQQYTTADFKQDYFRSIV